MEIGALLQLLFGSPTSQALTIFGLLALLCGITGTVGSVTISPRRQVAVGLFGIILITVAFLNGKSAEWASDVNSPLASQNLTPTNPIVTASSRAESILQTTPSPIAPNTPIPLPTWTAPPPIVILSGCASFAVGEIREVGPSTLVVGDVFVP